MADKQWLTIDDHSGEIELVNSLDLDPIVEENYRRRMDNPKGMSRRGTMMAVASIPIPALNLDIDGIAFLNSAPGSVEEREALNRFLSKHPEYRTSESRIGRRIL